jgi:2'-5' RNA ligase
MDSQRNILNNRYQQLWDDAIDHVRQGQIVIDPLLARREADRRRCLTVLIRPSAAVQSAVTAFLNELRGVDPEQYYYDISQLHVTVLSLFTATLDYTRLFARYDDYLKAVQAVLAQQAPAFEIEFTGVTLSREAILIQGYPDNSVLNDLREALRRELRARDLTEGLDGRYLLQTAHMTVVKFRAPLRHSGLFCQVLAKYRDHGFAQTRVQELQLVRNDWYMSRQSVELLRRYSVAGSADC